MIAYRNNAAFEPNDVADDEHVIRIPSLREPGCRTLFEWGRTFDEVNEDRGIAEDFHSASSFLSNSRRISSMRSPSSRMAFKCSSSSRASMNGRPDASRLERMRC